MAGVFITRGMTVTIPAGGLRISSGQAAEPRVTLHVHFDVCPTWCELAMRHGEAAKAAAGARRIAWETAEDTPMANDWDLAFQGKPVSEQTANYLTGLRARLNDLFPQGHPPVKRHTGDTQSSE